MPLADRSPCATVGYPEIPTRAQGRRSVFDGPTDVLYLPAGSIAHIRGAGRVAIAESDDRDAAVAALRLHSSPPSCAARALAAVRCTISVRRRRSTPFD